MKLLAKGAGDTAFVLMSAAFIALAVVTSPVFVVADLFMGDDQTV